MARHITKCLNNNCKQAHITTTAERRPQQLLCNRRSLRRRVQNNFQWNYPFSLSHLLFSAVKKNNQTPGRQRKSKFVITRFSAFKFNIGQKPLRRGHIKAILTAAKKYRFCAPHKNFVNDTNGGQCFIASNPTAKRESRMRD